MRCQCMRSPALLIIQMACQVGKTFVQLSIYFLHRKPCLHGRPSYYFLYEIASASYGSHSTNKPQYKKVPVAVYGASGDEASSDVQNPGFLLARSSAGPAKWKPSSMNGQDTPSKPACHPARILFSPLQFQETIEKRGLGGLLSSTNIISGEVNDLDDNTLEVSQSLARSMAW